MDITHPCKLLPDRQNRNSHQVPIRALLIAASPVQDVLQLPVG